MSECPLCRISPCAAVARRLLRFFRNTNSVRWPPKPPSSTRPCRFAGALPVDGGSLPLAPRPGAGILGWLRHGEEHTEQGAAAKRSTCQPSDTLKRGEDARKTAQKPLLEGFKADRAPPPGFSSDFAAWLRGLLCGNDGRAGIPPRRGAPSDRTVGSGSWFALRSWQPPSRAKCMTTPSFEPGEASGLKEYTPTTTDTSMRK